MSASNCSPRRAFGPGCDGGRRLPQGRLAPELELDSAAIDQALRTKGTNQGGIYAFSFVRKENVTDYGRVVPQDWG